MAKNITSTSALRGVAFLKVKKIFFNHLNLKLFILFGHQNLGNFNIEFFNFCPKFQNFESVQTRLKFCGQLLKAPKAKAN